VHLGLRWNRLTHVPPSTHSSSSSSSASRLAKDDALPRDGDPDSDEGLSITALYTAGVWAAGGMPLAELQSGKDTETVYRWVNRVMWVAGLLRWGLPSLAHSLLLRHRLLDWLAEGEAPLVEIGVGLSSRPYRVAGRGRAVLREKPGSPRPSARDRLSSRPPSRPCALR